MALVNLCAVKTMIVDKARRVKDKFVLRDVDQILDALIHFLV